MNERIYLIGENGGLHAMNEHDYDEEAVLQTLLEQYPDLLAGEQMDADAPRRWLLIKREMEIADAEDAAGRWSLDHLFVDQDAVLTLVEVKRSSDTRIRREVVGQMLDYAANAVTYWPVEQIRSAFEQTCVAAGKEPQQVVREFLQVDETDAAAKVAGFWDLVKSNLDAERIRLVFVADTIPTELRRIIEFLNGQMKSADVVAVEIKQFVGQGKKAMVPKVVGLTAKAATQKNRPRPEARPKFVEICETYNRSAPESLNVVGRGATYRTITPSDWPGRIHYEFLNHGESVGVELHLEAKEVTPLAPLLKELVPAVRKAFPHADFQWDQKWSAGRGRIFATFDDTVPSETTASAMRALIEATLKPVTDRLRELRLLRTGF